MTGGSLLIDGIDVRDVTLASLREQVGIVTQDTILFNDTVRNNIAYGQPHVPMKEVEAAARAALAHDFIQACPRVTILSSESAECGSPVASASASRLLGHC